MQDWRRARCRRAGRLLEQLESRVLLAAVPVVNLTAPKAIATELNGDTTGAGKFVLTRSGRTTSPLTVFYAIDGASTAVNGEDYDVDAPLTGTATFDAGVSKIVLPIHAVDTGLADGPKTVILSLSAGGTESTYTLGRHRRAKVTIVDHAPTVSVVASKAKASEINGQTSGRGVFTFKRSGPTTAPLTVQFDVSGTASEGDDFTELESHSIIIPAGHASAMLMINPIDDIVTEGKEKVIVTIAADGTPGTYHFNGKAAAVVIADDTRPIFFGTIAPLTGAVKNEAFSISYQDLLDATHAVTHNGDPIAFKVAAVKSGTLLENGSALNLRHNSIIDGDTLSWTSGATGSVTAFTLVATDGTHNTQAATISIVVHAAVADHPAELQVMTAALDQPQINAIVYVGNNNLPQVGTTSTFDLVTLEETTVNTFNVPAYLDTGASGILISNPTNGVLDIPLLSKDGAPVIYSDVGVAGSDDFQVSDQVRLALASFYQRTDIDQFSDEAQTIPITTPYTPAANNPLRLQVGPFVPTVDNPVTDEFGSIFDELQALDVIGMPAMTGRVVVIDPTRVNNFSTILDQLLANPDSFDLSALDADLYVHSFIYAPGTPFHPATTDTDPGIPDTDFHVKLSYGSFDRFTQVTPAGQPGPTLAHNPFIGKDPVRLLQGTPQANVPGIRITRAEGDQTLSSEGNWLLDTGAAASIISKAQAAALHVTYAPDTFGTDSPVLVDDNGDPLPDQFQLAIGGIGGQETLAGFYLDSMLVRTTEGDAADDSDPAHLMYVHEPVLVGDITVKDPVTEETLTLDGVFGMNNLIGSADFSLDAEGNIGDFAAANGYFNWVTFDEPNGVLGLSFDPAALTSQAATLSSPNPASAADSLSLLDSLQSFVSSRAIVPLAVPTLAKHEVQKSNHGGLPAISSIVSMLESNSSQSRLDASIRWTSTFSTKAAENLKGRRTPQWDDSLLKLFSARGVGRAIDCE